MWVPRVDSIYVGHVEKAAPVNSSSCIEFFFFLVILRRVEFYMYLNFFALVFWYQGSYSMFLSRPLSWDKGIKLKQKVATFHVVGRADRHFLLKNNICLR